jgi:nucleoside-diphosphate-sugar epimerase
MKQRRALVTGAAGFIGRNLTREMMNDGWEVLPVDDLSVKPIGGCFMNIVLILIATTLY